jgi:transcriptional regulator GlxA family with amidase domain
MTTNQPVEKTIAFVLYPELTPFDLVGPLQVMTSLSTFKPEFKTVVVAERLAPLATDIEVEMIADATFADVPQPDIIFIPGGVVGTLEAMRSATVLNYVRTAAESAEVVASVCTGALILASAGLLPDQPATTHWVAEGVLDNLGAHYRRRRWVDNGKVITAAGVSAGIDLALHLVERLTDLETMRKVQLDIEYDPQPPYGRIDWARLGRLPRTVRGAVSLAAPLMTRRPKRLCKQFGWG